MSRNLLFVLLLGAGLLPAGAQVGTEAPERRTEGAQAVKEEKPSSRQESRAGTGVEPGEAEEAQAQTKKDAKVISGMSILGNQEAPKSLVIVPWKSSEIGNAMDVSTMLDDSRQPVDREVFLRALRYYEIRSEKRP